ncbi:MAG TPA: YciI family protein [Kofleriaceae bacterium]|jgi:hypothetical protein
MKFMTMHKHDPKTEAGEKPPKELIEQMGGLMGKYMQSGQMSDGAGLGKTATRTRLTFKGGQMTRKDGPFAMKGEHELPHAAWMLEVKTRDEAVGWAERYGKILGDGEIELGKVTEPWDLGIMPEPPNPPLHLLLIDKSDAATESGGRTSQQKAAISRLRTEMQKAGVFQRGITLQPSSKAKRLVFKNNNLTTLDGPFSESKEMIGGYCVIEFPSVEECIEMTKVYATILGGNLEIDVRLVDESPDAA